MSGYSLVWLLIQEIDRLKAEIEKLKQELQSQNSTSKN